MKKSVTKKPKYTMQEKLDIAESVVTIIMFIMAVWGSIVSIEEGFWHKLNHVVTHYHHEASRMEHAALQKKHSDFSAENKR